MKKIDLHISVLLKETLDYLELKKDGIYLDATVGCGGHSLSILEALNGQAKLIGVDQDLEALEVAKQRLSKYSGSFSLIHDNFKNITQIVRQCQVEKLDGVLFDLGVSSLQLDQKERGFSYQAEASLDMRMDQSNPFTAAHIVNTASEKELSTIIRDYGEEPWAGRIASFIIKARQIKPFQFTSELVDVIKNAIPAAARRKGPHPARRTFQALRIAVNDELNIIKSSIEAAVHFLKPGGRVVVISFHSLEDRIVKETFHDLSGKCTCPKYLPECRCGCKAEVKILTKKPITPHKTELENNARSRSAKLRAVEKL